MYKDTVVDAITGAHLPTATFEPHLELQDGFIKQPKDGWNPLE